MSGVDISAITVHLLKIIGMQPSATDHSIAEEASSKSFSNNLGAKALAVSAVAVINCAVHLTNLKAQVHMIWLWIIIAVGAPVFQDGSKMWATLAMLIAIISLFFFTRFFNSQQQHPIIKTISPYFEWVSPRRVVHPGSSSRSDVLFAICASYVIFAFFLVMGEPALGGEIGWFLVGLISLGVLICCRWEDSPRQTLILGWVILGIWCCRGEIWNSPRKDTEILMLVLEAAHSHVLVLYMADIRLKVK